MPRRGENIYKRKDGRWEGRIRRYAPLKGNYYQSVYGKSYREVKDKMQQLRMERDTKDDCSYYNGTGGAAMVRLPVWLLEGGHLYRLRTDVKEIYHSLYR